MGGDVAGPEPEQPPSDGGDDGPLLALLLRQLGEARRDEAEQLLETARRVEAGEVPLQVTVPVERLAALEELPEPSGSSRVVWIPLASGLESLLKGALLERLGQTSDPWRLVSRLRTVVERTPIRHADAQLRRFGDFVTWASQFGARKHALRLPESQLGSRVWRGVGPSLEWNPSTRPRLATLAGSAAPGSPFDAFELVELAGVDLRNELEGQRIDIVLLELAQALPSDAGAALELAEVTAACEQTGALPLLWIDAASLLAQGPELERRANFTLPAGVVVLTDSAASRQRLEARGIRAHSLGSGEPLVLQTPTVSASASGIAIEAARVVQHRAEDTRRAEALRRLTAHAGLPNVGTRARLVSMICVSNRPERFESCLETFRRQTYPHKELVIVANVDRVSDAWLDKLPRLGPDVVILRTDAAYSLGESLNRARAVARGELWAKMDDDDHYGAHYLTDQVAALARSRASVVGKGTHYVYLESEDALYLDTQAQENAFSDRFVHGGTILADRRAVEGIDFMPVRRGTDSLFLQQCKLLGHRIYSSDRFNFAYMRYKATGHHTFDLRTRDLAAGYSFIVKGLDTSLIDV